MQIPVFERKNAKGKENRSYPEAKRKKTDFLTFTILSRSHVSFPYTRFVPLFPSVIEIETSTLPFNLFLSTKCSPIK